jgi:hypothetical protein
MARTLLRQLVTLAMPLIIGCAGLFGVGLWRRAEDTRWCRAATAASEAPQGPQAETQGTLEHQRSACANQRQRQRVMFGAMWRTGGKEMATCGYDLARLQLLSDPQARGAILAPYDLDSSGFDAGSREDQDRFIRACEAKGPGGRR